VTGRVFAWVRPRSPSSGRLRSLLRELEELVQAVYAAVAGTPTPWIDGAMRRLSDAADYSRLSAASAAALALAGGERGRRSALLGLTSLAAPSGIVNLVIKPLSRRTRPDRPAQHVRQARQVRMPASRSFPSGHAACATAFASGAGRILPLASLPLHLLSALVGYSRVHTGVHYPGDVIAGALIGAISADITAGVLFRWSPARVPDAHTGSSLDQTRRSFDASA
jgi:membrane-associated phospholipid phosphatase